MIADKCLRILDAKEDERGVVRPLIVLAQALKMLPSGLAHFARSPVFQPRTPAQDQPTMARPPTRDLKALVLQQLLPHICRLTNLFGMGSQFGKLELEALFAAVDIAEPCGDVADREECKAAIVGAIVLLANAHHVLKARLAHLVAHECIVLERGLAS